MDKNLWQKKRGATGSRRFSGNDVPGNGLYGAVSFLFNVKPRRPLVLRTRIAYDGAA
jgi:hypothetical protein